MTHCAYRCILGGLLVGFPTVAMAASGAAPDPLLFDVDLAICTAIVFLLTMAILRKFAWGPISSGLEKREQSIADNIATAENASLISHKSIFSLFIFAFVNTLFIALLGAVVNHSGSWAIDA